MSSLKLDASQDSTRSQIKSHDHPRTSGPTLSIDLLTYRSTLYQLSMTKHLLTTTIRVTRIGTEKTR
jgi:hypothetical protein